MPGEAGLGMYPFLELRDAYDAYWAQVHRRAPWLPPSLTWHADVHSSWRSPEMVVGYTCGWPLVTQLADHVQVVGTFEFDIAEADDHRYRSVIVARRDEPPASFAGAAAAVNGPDSLSGWVSLVTAVHGPGGTWTGAVRWTGAHLDSVRAVRDGHADVASIDSVSWAHIRRWTPELAEGVIVIGHGPWVPCLPVVAGMQVPADAVAELRRVMADALTDVEMVDHASSMLVRRFVPLELSDYLPLLELAPGR
jgi:ABC-type phosphate/phosphonate transport system substrate-binding protein